MENSADCQGAEASESASSITEALANMKISDAKDEIYVNDSSSPPMKEKNEPRSNIEAEPA